MLGNVDRQQPEIYKGTDVLVPALYHHTIGKVSLFDMSSQIGKGLYTDLPKILGYWAGARHAVDLSSQGL